MRFVPKFSMKRCTQRQNQLAMKHSGHAVQAMVVKLAEKEAAKAVMAAETIKACVREVKAEMRDVKRYPLDREYPKTFTRLFWETNPPRTSFTWLLVRLVLGGRHAVVQRSRQGEVIL